jgi:hypothetical protein
LVLKTCFIYLVIGTNGLIVSYGNGLIQKLTKVKRGWKNPIENGPEIISRTNRIKKYSG